MTSTKTNSFRLGQVVATPAALHVLEKSGETALHFLRLHAALDPGTLDEHDQKANAEAVAHEGDVENQSRVFSAYQTKLGEKIWVITEADRIVKMVEHKDASEAERGCRLCNSGLMALRSGDLFGLLARVGNANAAGEYYLVDVVNVANADGRTCAVVVTADPGEVQGINSRSELALAEAWWQARRRIAAMNAGVTLIAPETVWFAWDTQLGRDVLIEPNVMFGPGVTVADDVKIRANCHIEGAQIASGCEVGPFARLRPGTVLQAKAKIGNFVEVKKSVMGEGAKANHLSYIGDAEVGAGANLGAGTITCNYDGYFKYKTVIGERAFIGSNAALVAPVKIGADAIVAAGSTVTRDVAPGELRLVRAEQLVKPGWADRFHDAMKKKKAEKR